MTNLIEPPHAVADDQNIAPVTEPQPNTLPADAIPRPAVQSLAKVGEYFAPDNPLTPADMAEMLSVDLTYDSDNQALLFEQTRVLDTLFHRLVAQSCGAMNSRTGYNPLCLDDDRIKLALQAQKLCRQSASALYAIRRPYTNAPPTAPPRK